MRDCIVKLRKGVDVEMLRVDKLRIVGYPPGDELNGKNGGPVGRKTKQNIKREVKQEIKQEAKKEAKKQAKEEAKKEIKQRLNMTYDGRGGDGVWTIMMHISAGGFEGSGHRAGHLCLADMDF